MQLLGNLPGRLLQPQAFCVKLSRGSESGLPDPRGEVNRAMFDAIRSKRLRVYGLPASLPLLLRLGAVLAIE